MIKHHPSLELLTAFVAGELPASLSAAVAMHNELCPQCQQKVAAMTEQAAENAFELESAVEESESELNLDFFDEMIANITSTQACELVYENVPVSIEIKGKNYQLPRAIQHMARSKWNSLGKISRSRIELDEDEIRTSLLQIDAGGSVPEHTHKGFELTLLLDGSFKDEQGEYVAGDFIMLDAKHTHSPVTEEGCLCYTVANAPQHFTQGLNKLLNPIASLVY